MEARLRQALLQAEEVAGPSPTRRLGRNQRS